MGLGEKDSEILNWCMKHFDNIEFLMKSGVMDFKSASAEIHFTDLGVLNEINPHPAKIKRIDKVSV